MKECTHIASFREFPRFVLIFAIVCCVAACGSNEKREFESAGSFALHNSAYGDQRVFGLVAGNEALPGVRLVDANDAIMASDSAYWRLTTYGSGYYRIDNEATGAEVALGVSYRSTPGYAELVAAQRVSSQLWYVTPMANGYCRLTTVLFGEEQALAVTERSDGRVARLVARDEADEQHWKLIPRKDESGDVAESPCAGVAFSG